jgi:tRNA-specific 2-thiouridylase
MSGLRVLAAMSGGVDSATAAARAVDAGHEVTGVHLALSSNPSSYRTGARGCCTLEDARDARRAADVIGIPFYVWDMAERFHRDVVEDFVAEYAAGRTPNPCLRCNEKIKFAAVLDRARALGFDAVCTGHYARISDGTLRRAVDAGKDQSYVLAVLTSDQLSHAIFPLGDAPRPHAAAWPSRTSPTATTSASSPTATPRASWPGTWGRRPARSSIPPAPCWVTTTALTPSPWASVRACASARPPRTASPATCSTSSR